MGTDLKKIGVGQGVSLDWHRAVTQVVNAPDKKPFFSLQDNGAWPELTRQEKSVFGPLFSPGETLSADSPSYEIIEKLKQLSQERLPIIGGGAAAA